MRTVLVVTLAVLIIPDRSWGDDENYPGHNAALKYWQAYASMSRSLDAVTRKKVDSYADTLIDDAALKAVAQCEHAMELVHKAAGLSRCEWEVDLESGPTATIEHYEPVRALARLICLSARTHFEERLPATGVRDIMTMFALAHHTASDDLMVCRANQCAIETLGVVILARYLPKLNDEELRELREQIADLPAVRETQLKLKDLATAIEALEARRKMLLAAIAIQLKGNAAVEAFKDPATGRPFSIRQIDGGYELRSGLGRHVRITVGQSSID